MHKHKWLFSILSILFFCCLSTAVLAQDLEDLDKFKPKNFFSGMLEGDPFSVAGGIGLSMRNYNSWGAPNRQAPFSYTLSANSNIKIYKINMPFSFVFNGQNSSSTHPFSLDGIKESVKNRFVRIGASPKYKWAQAHLGHRSMNFSSLTYANQTFFGVGVELTPGKYRIAAMRGSIPTSEPVDLALFEVNREVFNRKATTVKLGYGDDSQFVDVIFMKGKDRTDLYQVNADSALVTPEENMVIGLNTQVQILKSLVGKLEIASSAYSQNALGEVGDESNHLLHPEFIMQANTSTEFSTAINGGLQFQGKGFNLGLDYQRFAPGYKTMGVYYFNDDLQNTTINTGFNFSKIQLAINLSAGVQTNNLDGNKPTTVKRTIGSANIVYSLKNFQANFNYNNFSNNVEYVLNPNLDSLNAVIVTENTGLNLSYTLSTKSELKHSISLAAISQVVNAPTPTEGTGDNTGSKMNTINLSYNISPKKDGIKWTFRANYNQNQLSGVETDRKGFGFGLSKKLLDKKLNLRIDNNYFISNTGDAQQRSLNSRLNADFKINSSHSLNFKVMVLNKNKTKSGDNITQTEMINTLQYRYRFNYKPKEKEDADKAKKEKEKTKKKTKKE